MTLESIYAVAIYQYNLWKSIQVERKITTATDSEKYQKERLDGFRLSLEPYIYHYLMETYGPKLSAFWQTYNPPKTASRAFVIVERRQHPNFWFILRNMAWANPDFAVYIFCSDENIDFIKALLGEKTANFNLIIAFKGHASRDRGKKEVDNLLSNSRFYTYINSEYILTLEMDTFIRKKIPETLFEGIYWGNTWGWVPHTPGGGGVTVRNTKLCAEHCKKHRPDPNIDLHTAQDAWLSDTVYADKGDFPDVKFRVTHIMENIPAEDPVAVHQFWTYLDAFQVTNKETFIKHLTNVLKIDI